MTRFEPTGGRASLDPPVALSLDELEALRLADLQGRSQAHAAAQMDVSRATFGRLIAAARGKVAAALIQGRAIHLADGPVAMQPPPRGSQVKFAIASNTHDIVSHYFGKSARFMVYTLEDGNVVATESRANPHLGRHHQGPRRGHGDSTRSATEDLAASRGRHDHNHDCAHHDDAATEPCGHGAGHGWAAELLGDCEAVITAGIGSGAVTQLRRAGIRLVLLERPAPLAAAAALYAEGRL